MAIMGHLSTASFYPKSKRNLPINHNTRICIIIQYIYPLHERITKIKKLKYFVQKLMWNRVKSLFKINQQDHTRNIFFFCICNYIMNNSNVLANKSPRPKSSLIEMDIRDNTFFLVCMQCSLILFRKQHWIKILVSSF